MASQLQCLAASRLRTDVDKDVSEHTQRSSSRLHVSSNSPFSHCKSSHSPPYSVESRCAGLRVQRQGKGRGHTHAHTDTHTHTCRQTHTYLKRCRWRLDERTRVPAPLCVDTHRCRQKKGGLGGRQPRCSCWALVVLLHRCHAL